MVVRPGPPRSEAWRALKPPSVPNAPVPGDVSVKYVHGQGGPSKASRSIRVSRLTVTAAGVALTESNRESRPSAARPRDASTPGQEEHGADEPQGGGIDAPAALRRAS